MAETKPTAGTDLYAYHNEAIEEPPKTFGAIVRRIGPGLILTASIVGSGELIATTQLGAKVGYVLLWAVVLSCLIKIVIHAEIGRYTIATGETALVYMNHIPGPKIASMSWINWLWAIAAGSAMFALGGMYEGVAQVMNQLVSGVPVDVWVYALAAITLWVLLAGSYGAIEFGATVLVVIFTIMTVITAGMLVSNPQYFNFSAVMSGMVFDVPAAGFVAAIAVFGITGVGAVELTQYPYWCVEKGYARFTGVREQSEAWLNRARGWIKVMHTDVLASALIYTVATVAFYLLGAGVLHSKGLNPEGGQMIAVLSTMYTEMLGSFGLYAFYFGAIAVLYSTIFSATAGLARQFSDFIGLTGAYKRDDFAARLKWQRIVLVIFVIGPLVLRLIFKQPALMVSITGIVIAIMLPLVAFSTLYLRYKKLPQEVAPSSWVTNLLWLCTILIIVIMTWFAWTKMQPLFIK
jgi:Mn2+/Fe2+ NRAMP family transporter